MRWRLASLALIVLAAWLLAACGGKDGDAEPAATPSESSEVAAAPAEPRLPTVSAIADAETSEDAPDDASIEDDYGDDGAASAEQATDAAYDPLYGEGGQAEAAPATATAAPQPTVAAATPTPPPSPVAGYRLRVPRLAVDAVMIDLGVDANGVIEVPLEAQTVSWYRFTSLPGQAGNTLLGGHITWRGATAVFRYLEDVEAGDEIFIDTPSGETLHYIVEEVWWAEPNTSEDVRRVIGTRSGRETVTLFTCGGVWDTTNREYSHRRVVTAVRV